MLTVMMLAGSYLQAGEPIDLFDGKTLDGWTSYGGKHEYSVRDGLIIGKVVEGEASSYLCTDRQFDDFELTFEVKYLVGGVNSGCQLRSLIRTENGEKNFMKKGSIYGPQVEINLRKNNDSANIYGQGLGTDYLKPKKSVKSFRPTEWNRIRVVAKGPRIQTWINGEAVADIVNEDVYKTNPRGMIGLQIHKMKEGTGPYEIAWKSIRLTELETSAATEESEPKKECSASQAPPSSDVVTEGEPISLFDGKTLGGWVTLNDEPITSGWDVVDGAIHVVIGEERSGHIKTTRRFENFDLEFEWRIAEGGNSGVKYLTKESDSDRGRAYYGCEYQLLDDDKHKNGRTPTKTAGSLYDLYAPDDAQKQLKPIGEFNHSRIILDNGQIEHWLNGKKIVEATIGSEDWQTRISKSKVSSVKDFANGPGVILLQEHLSEAWFKNIRITLLPKKNPLSEPAPDLPPSADTAESKGPVAIEEDAFEEASAAKWQEVFSDPGTGGWKERWFLDGEVGKVKSGPNGMELTAGPEFKNDAHHMVLWTRESFSGDLKIEYDYTRLDDETRCVNILYIQATGSGEGRHVKDISKWNELRRVPAMRMYFDHMHAYHISYAAFPNNEDATSYIRARRYMPEASGLKGTNLEPDYYPRGLFKKGVPHKITVIKKARELFMRIENAEQTYYCRMTNPDLPPILEGRVGLRHMFTRSSRYKNFRISTALPDKQGDRAKSRHEETDI